MVDRKEFIKTIEDILRKYKIIDDNDFLGFRNNIKDYVIELNEVNKKSPKRIARLVEIEYILDGLNASQELQRLRKENSDLKYRLVEEGIDIYE